MIAKSKLDEQKYEFMIYGGIISASILILVLILIKIGFGFKSPQNKTELKKKK